jgi:dTDP-4-amino-4,6-dideoxygalactose transaminase
MATATAAKHAIAFGHARTGLVAVLEAGGLQRGDEVLLSPLTCKVVPLSLIAAGFKPVYVDIAPGSLNLDPARLADAAGPATRAVLFQHTYGTTTGIQATAALCRERNLMLVEDAAQSMPHAASGAGRFGWATLYSNNLRKPLPAGSGAIVTTNDPDLAAAVARRRDRLPSLPRHRDWMLSATATLHAWVLGPRLYWPLFAVARAFGGIYRDDSIDREVAAQIVNAAVRPSKGQLCRGDRWLARAEALVRQRTEACAHYEQLLRGSSPQGLLQATEWRRPLYFFPVLATNKDQLLRAAQTRWLEMVAWPLRLPIYPALTNHAMARYGYEPRSCPEAERIAQQLVGLPTDFGATPALRRALATVVAQAGA